MKNGNVFISDNRDSLDLKFIHDFITNSYWAKGRTFADVQTCADHSLNFGVYINSQQIGYARVVTDYAVFAYIMDLFIDENHRNLGYSKLLMEAIMNHARLTNIKSWKLATSNSHFLYAKFGFRQLEKPLNMMEKKNRPINS